MLSDAWDIAIGLCEAVREWVFDHLFELSMCVLLFGAIAGFVWAIRHSEAQRQEQIATCVRLFEYSHERCEFIVQRNIVIVEASE